MSSSLLTAGAYSVWLEFAPIHQGMLQAIVDAGVKEFDSPTFDAHMTILGLPMEPQGPAGIKLLEEKTEQIAASATQEPVELTGFGIRHDPFQALFLQAVPTTDLVQLNRIARELFGREDDPPFMPHVSVAYGIQDQPREDFIRNYWHMFFHMIQPAHVSLWDCQGTPEEWKPIERFPIAA